MPYYPKPNKMNKAKPINKNKIYYSKIKLFSKISNGILNTKIKN